MGDSPDELERMLSVLRYSFSNQLKFVRYKIGKPYNSVLGECHQALLHRKVDADMLRARVGEHFQCCWSLPPVTFDSKSKAPVINAFKFDPATNNGELVAMSAMSTPMMLPADARDDV